MDKIFYSLGVVRGNMCYNNSFVSDLSEFTEEEKTRLLNGEEVQDHEGDFVYICENE